MTNDRLFGLFLRTLAVPLLLLIVGVGGYILYSFWQKEAIAKELYRWEPVLAEGYTVTEVNDKGEFALHYTYRYGGSKYGSGSLSPYDELNDEAWNDEKFLEWLSREDHPPLTIYVDPADPARSSAVRGWAQGDRAETLFAGSGILTVGLVLLYFSLRKVPEVGELFKDA